VELDLKQLLRMARQWWWLLLLAPLIGGFTAHYVGSQRTPLYSASATLFISPGSLTPDNYNSIFASQNIAQTYATLATSAPVLDAAAKDLGLPSVGASASASDKSLFMSVSAIDTNPERAAAVANAVSDEFVKYIQQQSAAQTADVRGKIDAQIKETNDKIADIENQIAALQANGGPKTDSDRQHLQSLQNTRDGLVGDISQLQITARQIDVEQATTQTRLSVTSPALAPSAPFAPQTKRSTLLGAFAGLMIAIGAVALLEYLDNSVRTSDELSRLTGSANLATIATASRVTPGGRQVYVLTDPKSPSAEAIRLLRANLEFAAAAKPITSLAVSSAGPGEGKSTLTANLAVVMAQAGFETVIIDTDLRKPTQHKIFGIGNDQGLTTLLSHPKREWQSTAVRVAVPRLSLIPSGPLPPNPADLLSLDRFDELLEQVTDAADVVLLDTSPVLAVSDPLVVATKTSGVMLVCRAGNTRRDALRRAAASFHQGGIRLVGTVLNNQKAREDAGYYYYGYYGSEPTPGHAASSPDAVRPAAPAPGPSSSAVPRT
jgi:non-specific protein-tyrosine kinase